MSLAHRLFWRHLGIVDDAFGIESRYSGEFKQKDALVHIMECGGTPCLKARQVLLAMLGLNEAEFTERMQSKDSERLMRRVLDLKIQHQHFGVR